MDAVCFFNIILLDAFGMFLDITTSILKLKKHGIHILCTTIYYSVAHVSKESIIITVCRFDSVRLIMYRIKAMFFNSKCYLR